MMIGAGFAAGADFGNYDSGRHVKASKSGVSLHENLSALSCHNFHAGGGGMTGLREKQEGQRMYVLETQYSTDLLPPWGALGWLTSGGGIRWPRRGHSVCSRCSWLGGGRKLRHGVTLGCQELVLRGLALDLRLHFFGVWVIGFGRWMVGMTTWRGRNDALTF
jgi:hypothetical protein